jgi:hypothetical protein
MRETSTSQLSADDIDCGQPPFSYQPASSYSRQLLWYLIASALGGYHRARLASLIGLRPEPTHTLIHPSSQAAHQNLCPVPGSYDWWAYSTS